MKTTLILLMAILFISVWAIGHSSWHLDRNEHNQLPDGVLKFVKGNVYADENGLSWELQPHIKNKFHQPDQEIEPVSNPYPNVDGDLVMDTKNPNLKFLSKLDNGESYEAILQPNGEYLIVGPKRGSYNYSHPGGFLGSLKHVFLDVIPHFVNSKYTS